MDSACQLASDLQAADPEVVAQAKLKLAMGAHKWLTNSIRCHLATRFASLAPTKVTAISHSPRHSDARQPGPVFRSGVESIT